MPTQRPSKGGPVPKGSRTGGLITMSGRRTEVNKHQIRSLPPPVLRTRASHQPPRARHQAPRPDQATEDPGARHPRAGERRTPETRCASSKRTPQLPRTLYA